VAQILPINISIQQAGNNTENNSTKHAIMSIYKAKPDCLIRSMIFRSFVE